jgi:hypothetical protein
VLLLQPGQLVWLSLKYWDRLDIGGFRAAETRVIQAGTVAVLTDVATGPRILTGTASLVTPVLQMEADDSGLGPKPRCLPTLGPKGVEALQDRRRASSTTIATLSVGWPFVWLYRERVSRVETFGITFGDEPPPVIAYSCVLLPLLGNLGLSLLAACAVALVPRGVLRLVRRGRCIACGYDLHGLPAGAKCPECGGQPRVGIGSNVSSES